MNSTQKIKENQKLIKDLRKFSDSDGFVIVYIESQTSTASQDSYFIDENYQKVENLWEAKIYKTEDEAIFSSREVSFGEATTSTIISSAHIFVYDAVKKLKEINSNLKIK